MAGRRRELAKLAEPKKKKATEAARDALGFDRFRFGHGVSFPTRSREMANRLFSRKQNGQSRWIDEADFGASFLRMSVCIHPSLLHILSNYSYLQINV